MVCDAIATARARVKSTEVLKALSPEQIGEALRQYLIAQEGFQSVVVSSASNRAVMVRVKGAVSFEVTFYPQTGEVAVRSAWGVTFNRDKLAQVLAVWVGQVAGVAYQEKVAALLSQLGAVTSRSRTSGHHSALVLKLQV